MTTKGPTAFVAEAAHIADVRAAPARHHAGDADLAAVFMNIVLLCPTRYWALFKLRDNAWQSRGLTAKTVLPGGGTACLRKSC
ncbi:hypothetical protein [Streptomyces sp. SID5643]|uniref:hypothetical protein n=1 Tax=Streptomyces sp. SID5643 TaxID=2690307 RepID=UPI001926EE6E|nr:hypothetical protein [Streptomyces sp. SID5643]